MPSVFVHIVAYCSVSFHFLPSFTAFAYLFIRQWRLQLLPLFTIVSNVAMTMDVQISLWDSASNTFQYTSRSEIVWIILWFLFFWGSIILFSLMVISFCILISSAQVFTVSPRPHQCLLFSVFVLIATILLGVR